MVDKNSKDFLFTFAWEKSTKSAELLRYRMKISQNIVKDSDVLVVIGYSFPLFNRLIDKEIFNSLTESGKLKKIYYQDPNKSGEFLKSQFNLSSDIEIISITDVDSYFIPNEL